MSESTATAVESTDLAGIVVGETAISDVRGEEGRLIYRGYPIEDLAERPFLQVVWLLVFGEWPDAAQEQSLRSFMATHRHLSAAEQRLLEALPRGLHPMLVLQSAVPAIAPPAADGEAPIAGEAAHGLAIAAKLPALLAAWHRLQRNEPVIPANGELSPHEDFLQMFHGRAASAEEVRVLDAAQILQMEHGFNASTFAGRVCASTEAPVPSVLSVSIGTLYGRLHGGADQAALAMAREIGSPEAAPAYVERCLAEKVKIMGMGHREYRTLDPRAALLKPMAAGLCREGESRRLFETLCAVEAACQRAFAAKGKEVWANVEFYKGAVFHCLGIPDEYFTALFAMARVYGYLAHYLEFSSHSRLIRPRARYIGAMPSPDSPRQMPRSA